MNHMPFKHIILAAGFVVGCVFAVPAFAATTQLQDGRWIDLETGAVGASPTNLELPVGGAVSMVSSGTDTPIASALPVGSLRDAIARARTMLQEHLVATAPKNPKVVSSQNTWVDVTLAIWNPASDEIRLVTVQKDGAKLKVDPDDQDLKIAVAYSNGVNSQFTLASSSAAPLQVVGEEYPIFRQITVKKKKAYELDPVVYVPYSDGLRTPEVIAWGKDTLDGYINDVYANLRARGVHSRAFPDRLLADVISPELARAVVIIEHAGDQTLLRDPQGVMNTVHIMIGTNQQAAYSYSVSTAGARGLVQFIPSTYKLMVKRAELGLEADFVKGMSDPKNAIKAEVAYLDAELATMPANIKMLNDTDPKQAAEYMAASYNGGSGRVRKAIAAFGDNWEVDQATLTASLQNEYDTLFAQANALKKKIVAEDDPKIWKPMQTKLNASRAERAKIQARITTLKASALRAETVGYVKKLRAIMDILKPDPPVSSA